MSGLDVLLVGLWLAPIFVAAGSLYALAWWTVRKGVMK